MALRQISGSLFGLTWHRTWKIAEDGEHIQGQNNVAEYGGKHVLTREELDLLNIGNPNVPLTLIGMRIQGFKVFVVLAGVDPQHGRKRIVRELQRDQFTERNLRRGAIARVA